MKGLASFGPGGAVGVFAEKLCHVLFSDAYEMEDPNFEDVRKDDETLTNIRQKFVE